MAPPFEIYERSSPRRRQSWGGSPTKRRSHRRRSDDGPSPRPARTKTRLPPFPNGESERKANTLAQVLRELKGTDKAPRIDVYARNEGGVRREAQFDKIDVQDDIVFRLKIKGDRAPLSKAGFSGSYPTAKQLRAWLLDAGYQPKPVTADWTRVRKLPR